MFDLLGHAEIIFCSAFYGVIRHQMEDGYCECFWSTKRNLFWKVFLKYYSAFFSKFTSSSLSTSLKFLSVFQKVSESFSFHFWRKLQMIFLFSIQLTSFVLKKQRLGCQKKKNWLWWPKNLDCEAFFFEMIFLRKFWRKVFLGHIYRDSVGIWKFFSNFTGELSPRDRFYEVYWWRSFWFNWVSFWESYYRFECDSYRVRTNQSYWHGENKQILGFLFCDEKFIIGWLNYRAIFYEATSLKQTH